MNNGNKTAMQSRFIRRRYEAETARIQAESDAQSAMRSGARKEAIIMTAVWGAAISMWLLVIGGILRVVLR